MSTANRRHKEQKHRIFKTIAHFALVSLTATLVAVLPGGGANAAYTSSTSGTLTTLSFSYTGSLETFTIPDNVTEITLTVTGAEGGRGGEDYSPRPKEEGYKGVVTGTIPVTPGRIITVAVGQRGSDPILVGCEASGSGNAQDANRAIGGNNPLGIYKGGDGAAPGPDGCSGFGGAGGAASVVKIGTSSNAAADALIVAGGSGGSGGNGQFAALQGGISQNTFAASATVGTNGEHGLNTYTACQAAPRPDGRCDGGGGAGGGGGAQGGKRGEVPFGTGSNTEWYGLGAYPGQNSTSDYVGLTESYNYYTYSGDGKRHGNVVITYSSGVPGAPTAVNGTAANSAIDLYWTAPSSTGAAAISGYQVQYAVSPYSSWTTATDCTGTTTTCSIANLTNGTGYKFRVLAKNSIGDSSYSSLSQVLTPSGPPSAPTINSLTPADGSLSVAFTAGASTATITDYEYTIDGGTTWYSFATTSSPLTISGLANGTAYSVKIRAVNSAGPGSASNSVSESPSALPGAPTITNIVSGGDGTSLVVSFVSGYTGGSSILDYEYATSVGENSNSFGSYTSVGSTSSPFTITGLTNGTTYTVKLRAKNSAGYGAGSAFQTGVTLAAPSAPTISSVTSNDGRLAITYADYNSSTNGGSAISKIEYSTNGGSTWLDAGTLATTFTILGLNNGTAYSIKLRATNAIGTSPASASTSATPASVPDAPRLVVVTATPGGATVTWQAPVSNGGAAITGYTATAYNASTGGSSVANCTTNSLSCSISGLTNGTTYYVSVVATNSAGSGAASTPRVQVIPAALPGTPTINSISAGNAYLSVAFTAGSADANNPITGYQYTFNDGSTWANATGTTSPLLISSLTNGTTYSVKIRATSALGVSAKSSAVSGKPFTKPANVDPGTISYVAGSSSVSVSWTAPSNNGSAITNSYVSAFSAAEGGSAVTTCSTSTTTTSCNLTGLTNGTTYYVSIETVNGAGYSERSTPRVAVKPGTSSAVSLTSSTTSTAVGSSVTLTATVTDGASGTVSFQSSGIAITGCSSVAIVSSVATCTTTGLVAKTHSLKANYSGNSTYASSSSSEVSVAVIDRYTITYDKRGGTQTANSEAYSPGSSAIVLPTPTKTSYVFDGWYTSATQGIRVGRGGDPYEPTSSRTIYARWIQKSLYGMGASTKIGSITTSSGIGNTFSANSASTAVELAYPAGALPNSTVIDVYLLADTSRAAQLITDTNSFVVSLVVAWLAPDETVPTTAAGKPLVMKITNPSIKAGQQIYALLGDEVSVLGTATQDGEANIELTEDPEIVIANTKPGAPTNVVGLPADAKVAVSWSAPSSNGGTPITSYTVTANNGATCTTSTLTCEVTGLSNGTAYTFTVTATNAVGTGSASTTTPTLTPASAGGAGGSSTGTPPSEAPFDPVKDAPVLELVPTVTEGPKVFVDGVAVSVEILATKDNKTLEVKGTGWSMAVESIKPDGTSESLQDKALKVSDSNTASFNGSGLKADSEVRVFLFSTPKYLGTVKTSSSGSYLGQMKVPTGLPAGVHTLRFSGTLANGSVISQLVPVVVEASPRTKVLKTYFTPGSALLTVTQKSFLKKALNGLGKSKIMSVKVSGFVQKTKYSAGDLALAKARASAVVAFLRAQGMKIKIQSNATGIALDKTWQARRTETTLTLKN